MARADDRYAEIHQERLDKADFNKDKRDRLRAANEEIASVWSETLQGEPKANIVPSKPGLAGVVPAGQENLSGQTASGLMSQYGKSVPKIRPCKR